VPVLFPPGFATKLNYRLPQVGEGTELFQPSLLRWSYEIE
jgi:hypothetical protein